MIIKVNTTVPYEIIIENGAIDKIGEFMSPLFKKNTKVLIVSDTNVFPIYGQRVINSLEKADFIAKYHVFQAGEDFKTLETVQEIYASLTKDQFTRADVVVALGGGVTGDMAGFASATYLRGIDVVQVPTSLLAQVDSSIGGKTGVDLPQGKNLVGAFHQPRLVISDPEVISTLPEEYFVDGLGEIVKYACIEDEQLFENLNNSCAIENLEDTIYRCADCKRKYVEEDANEKGKRILLNFGHTLGHAIEKLHNFSGISHGKAVAIGMVLICKFGEALGCTEKGTVNSLEKLLIKLNLPVSDEHELDEILKATVLDKKSVGKDLKLIFISSIGTAFVKKFERDDLTVKFESLLENNI